MSTHHPASWRPGHYQADLVNALDLTFLPRRLWPGAILRGSVRWCLRLAEQLADSLYGRRNVVQKIKTKRLEKLRGPCQILHHRTWSEISLKQSKKKKQIKTESKIKRKWRYEHDKINRLNSYHSWKTITKNKINKLQPQPIKAKKLDYDKKRGI